MFGASRQALRGSGACLSGHANRGALAPPDSTSNETISAEKPGLKSIKTEGRGIVWGGGPPGGPVEKLHESAQALHGSRWAWYHWMQHEGIGGCAKKQHEKRPPNRASVRFPVSAVSAPAARKSHFGLHLTQI